MQKSKSKNHTYSRQRWEHFQVKMMSLWYERKRWRRKISLKRDDLEKDFNFYYRRLFLNRPLGLFSHSAPAQQDIKAHHIDHCLLCRCLHRRLDRFSCPWVIKPHWRWRALKVRDFERVRLGGRPFEYLILNPSSVPYGIQSWFPSNIRHRPYIVPSFPRLCSDTLIVN